MSQSLLLLWVSGVYTLLHDTTSVLVARDLNILCAHLVVDELVLV